MFTLQGRTCVFAGATGMVGRGAVQALVESGMNVVMVTHNPDSAKEVVAAMEGKPGRCLAMSNDKDDSLIYQDVEEMFGSVDVIISNTGSFNSPKKFEEITEDEMTKKVSFHVAGPMTMVQKALPFLERSKAPRVLLMASAGAQDGFAGENVCDSVARGAVISLTYCLARELADRGITVNCIAKSAMVNDHAPHGPEDLDTATLQDSVPLGRIGSNDEFGAAVAYLASEEAGFVTGQVLNLSGGLHIG